METEQGEGFTMTERRLRVLVEKNKEHRLTVEEEAAIKLLSNSEAFYSLGFSREQVTQFWDWYNQQIKPKKQEGEKNG
jgi:hypothetical protein